VTHQNAPRTDRVTDHPAERIFVDRWSPRGFTDEALSDAVLHTFFEAARWAPSSFNSQPWRFLYALRGQPEFDVFLAPLIEFNRGWAQHAAALLYVISKKDFTPPGKTEPAYSRTHSFDAGAAWANFANQVALGGWAAHGMSGFDVEAATKALGVPTVSSLRSLSLWGGRAMAPNCRPPSWTGSGQAIGYRSENSWRTACSPSAFSVIRSQTPPVKALPLPIGSLR